MTYVSCKEIAFGHETTPQSHRFRVAADGEVRVLDPVADYYTTCHSLSDDAMDRIRQAAANLATLRDWTLSSPNAIQIVRAWVSDDKALRRWCSVRAAKDGREWPPHWQPDWEITQHGDERGEIWSHDKRLDHDDIARLLQWLRDRGYLLLGASA